MSSKKNGALLALLLVLLVVAWWSTQKPPASVQGYEPLTSQLATPPHTAATVATKPTTAAAPSRAPASVDRYKTIDWPKRATLFRDAKLVSESETPRDAEGRFEHIRVVETRKKYPLIRIKERLQETADGTILYRGHQAMVADHVMITVQPGKTAADVEAMATRYGGRIRRAVNAKTYLITFDASAPDALDQAVQHFMQQADLVKSSEPDYILGLGE